MKYALIGSLCAFLGWILSTEKYAPQIAWLRNRVVAISRELANEREIRNTLERERKNLSMNELSFRLVSDDLRSRSGSGPEVPIVTIHRNQPVINLELPVSSEVGRSYRAVLKSLLKNRPILTEDFQQPSQAAAEPIIVFSVPGSLLQDSQDYAVIVYVRATQRTVSEVDSFTFHVIKQDH